MENLNNEITEVSEAPEVDSSVIIDNDEKMMKARFEGAYNQLLETNDPAEMTAIVMTCTHYYSYGLLISNSINDRQGKNRLTVEHGTYKLNKYSMEVDVNIYRQEEIEDMVVLILNSYLSNKQALPTNKPKKADGMLSRVKALYINLFNTGNYGFIHKLATPSYMKNYVNGAFNLLKEMREESLSGLIEYLESIDEYEAAYIIKETGEDAWRSIKTDTNDAFKSVFAKVIDRLHDRIAVENAYRTFRGNYVKSSHKIAHNGLYDIFEITEDAYSGARKRVFTELTELSSEDGQLRIINSILNER